MNSSHLAADLHVHSFQVVCSFNLFLVSIFGDGVFFFLKMGISAPWESGGRAARVLSYLRGWVVPYGKAIGSG